MPEDAKPTIVHAVIEAGAPLDGRLLREANLPRGCLIVSIHRADGELVPVAETRLAGGDEITVVLSPGHAKAVRFRELICAPMA